MHPNVSEDNLLRFLKKNQGTDDVQLVECKVTPGSEVGDNYSGMVTACDMTAKVKGVTKEFHWIIKLPVTDAQRVRFMRLAQVEEREAIVYSRVIPAFKKMNAERKANVELNFADLEFAEVIKDDKGQVTNSSLAMTNLTKLGFSEAINKKKGLNLHYTKLALAEIAKFHAFGYAYIKSLGGIEAGLKQEDLITTDSFFTEPNEELKAVLDSFQPQMLKTFATLLEATQEPGQDFVGAFEASHKQMDIMERRRQLILRDPKAFNTLCHGDAWFNNMMFTHRKDDNGEEKPVKCILIDLAMTKWANPCTDLAYFLFLSTTPQLRKTHLDELLGHYHDTLIRVLAKLGEDPAVYPFRQLLKDYKQMKLHGLVQCLWVLPFIICKKEDVVDPASFEGVDWNDPDQMAAALKKSQELMVQAFRNEPQIKIVMGGSFLELVEDGVFQIPCK